MVDTLISKVQQLPAMVAGAVSASASSSSSSSAAPQLSASALPAATKDAAFWPIIPVGHTAYTWYGVEGNPAAIAAAAGVSGDASAPSSSSAPQSASATPAPAAAAQQKPAQGEKKEKKEKAPKQPKQAKPAEPEQPEFTKLDIRVGQIVSASRHPRPEVTSLYVEQIDVGEAEPRTIVSGLVKYIPLEEFSKMRVCVICNLKPSALQGVTSHGMVLAASTGDGESRHVEVVAPPSDARVGDRVLPLDLYAELASFAALPQVDPKKKNSCWAPIQAKLKTDGEGYATYDGKRLGVEGKGAAKAATLKDAVIS